MSVKSICIFVLICFTALCSTRSLPILVPWENRFIDVPDEIDWRLKGCVLPVGNQGQADNAALFSSTEAITGAICVVYGGLMIRVSQQEIIECCPGYQSASPAQILQCIQDIGGIDDDFCYPRVQVPQKCHYNSSCKAATIYAVKLLPPGDEGQMKVFVAMNGPVAVSVDASHSSFQLYKGGVYYEQNCSSSKLDHSMLVVGYGSLGQNQDYWIVQNGWGDNWGLRGYILMARNKNNNCGIATRAVYPFLK